MSLNPPNRGTELVDNFEEAFARMYQERSWWPGLGSHHVRAMLRLRELSSSSAALRDGEFIEAAYRSLRKWLAFRGVAGGVSRSRFESEIQKVSSLLPQLEDTSIVDLDLERDGQSLSAAFVALENMKPSTMKWVAISKALYHLLPDLVLPMDNTVTAPFLGRRSLPRGLDQEWLFQSYWLFGSIARRVGRETLERLARSNPYLASEADREAVRLGLARVVDFAMAGSLLLGSESQSSAN
jgi:hypothetical protein